MKMASSSKRWAAFVSFMASLVLFLLVLFQVPLFRAPCRIGMCTSPMMVTSSHLIATEICPKFIVKALLYPGALARAFVNNRTIPSYGELLKLHKLTNLKKGSTTIDFQCLEILAGSYLTVAGALLGVVTAGRMSFCGILVILWGFLREVLIRKYSDMKPVRGFNIYPAMSIAVLCACLSIRKDVRKLIRSCRAKRVTKSLRYKSKYQ